MKFAVWVPLDQTIGYLDAEGYATTKHPEAILHNTREAAQKALDEWNTSLPTHYPTDIGGILGGQPIPEERRPYGGIEDVPDEAEFRAREDTW